MKHRKVGKVTDNNIKIPGFDIIKLMVIELARVGHEERMNGEGV